MAKYQINAKRVTEYLVTVEAESPEMADEMLADWIADDFEPYITDNYWSFEIEEATND